MVPISLVTGPANAGKAHVLLEAVRAHLARGSEPWLVVPTDADQARYRRELADKGVTMGVRVERFQGLLAEIVRRAARSEQALGELARERLLASIAARTLGPVGPGLAKALSVLVADLEVRRITPTALREAARRSGLASAERLCEVFQAYHAALANGGRVDRETRFTRALDQLRRRPALWGATPVALYGFDSFTELQLDGIETLGRVVDAPVTVSLPYEPARAAFVGRAHAFHRLRPFAHGHTQCAARAEYYHADSRPALHHLERGLLEPDAMRVEPGQAVRLLEGASPRAELELVAGQIRSLIDQGMPPEQIAIVHRSPDTVVGLLAEVLDDSAVPHGVRMRTRFAHTAVGGALVGLMRCAFGAMPHAGRDGLDGTGARRDGRLGDLLAWLRAPGVLARPELADRLEATALRQGALDAERARGLWEAERWPLDRIDRLRAAAGSGPHALLDALGVELHSLFCAPRQRAGAALAEVELQEARALAGATRALEELRELARCAADLFPAPAELIDVLAELELSTPRRPSTGGVVVCDPLSLRARRVRALFLCGLQEGVFPAPARVDPLIAPQERVRLAHEAGLALAEQPDALAAERYLLYALCSRPEQLLALSWHTADHDGTPAAPSLFLDDVCDLFTERLRERTARRSAAAAAWPGPGAPHQIAPARVGQGQIAPLRDERVLAGLRERTLWSASSLEAWASCPVRWFVERLLRLDGLDADPEPLARGAIAHAVLRDTLHALRERTGSARLTPASVGQAKRLMREALAQRCRERPLSAAPERLPGAKRRLQADLERYLDHAAQAPSPLEPTHLELEFGFSEQGDGLPALELGDGVRARGRIDRVDVGADGQAVVYDYKGRTAPPGARWAGDGALQIAIYMHAVERLLGHASAGGFYQPLAGRDLRARGLLDADSGIDLDCVRTDRRERAEVDEILHECRRAALLAATQARAGALEPRPATCSYDGGCSYPEICRCS